MITYHRQHSLPCTNTDTSKGISMTPIMIPCIGRTLKTDNLFLSVSVQNYRLTKISVMRLLFIQLSLGRNKGYLFNVLDTQHFRLPKFSGTIFLGPNFQAACCLNIWLCLLVSFISYFHQLVLLVSFVSQFHQSVCQKKISATSKQGRRLRFGMLTVLTNIRSTKVLHHASCIKHHASFIMNHPLQLGN